MQIPPQIRAPHAVVYDLEFTAWDGSMARKWMGPGEYKEVIQIGAVKVSDKFEPIETLNLLVRPRLTPVLSDVIQKLTGITDDGLADRGCVGVLRRDNGLRHRGALAIGDRSQQAGLCCQRDHS